MSDLPVGPHTASGPATPTRVGGRYVLRAVLGRGGMATVHRARDEVLDRDVAVKLLHAHLASDPAFLERFRREARAAAALSHPHVVAVHDWGETEDGPFLVLQLVEGPSLREVLRHRRRLHPEEAVTVLTPAAAGLASAHTAGLVHRDVKPENLLLGLDGTVRVTDFGLARAAASATSTFGTDVLVGSPHYLSPEAVRGEPLDPRADVYALGVVLFEALTGRPPFEADTPFATAVQHTAHRVPDPSSVVPSIPAALDEVVRRATEPDPAARYRDAAAFGAALTAAVPASTAPLPALFADDTTVDPSPSGGTAVLGPEAQDTTVAGSAPPPPNGTSVAWEASGAQLWPPPDHDPPPPPEALADGADGAAATDGPVGWLEDLAAPGTDVAAPAGAAAVPGATDPEADDLDLSIVGAPEDDAAFDGIDDDGDGDDEAPVPRRRRRLLALLVVLGLLAASGLGGYLLWDRVLAPVTDIPPVTEAPVDAAVAALETAGFTVEVADDRPHDLQVPAGHVLSQDPSGRARQGTTVELVVSAGPRQIPVPDVTGADLEEATAQLEAADLELGDVGRTHHEEVPEGQVVSSEPEADEVVDEASTVDVVVSRGPRPREVPDLGGRTLEEAQTALRELGLEPAVAGRVHADAPEGAVVGQSPTAGVEVARGSTVELTLSDGPEPIEVPNVRRKLRDEAVAILEDLGFEVEVETRGGVGAFLNPGRVFEQDPGPGTDRRPGERVLIYAYED